MREEKRKEREREGRKASTEEREKRNREGKDERQKERWGGERTEGQRRRSKEGKERNPCRLSIVSLSSLCRLFQEINKLSGFLLMI